MSTRDDMSNVTKYDDATMQKAAEDVTRKNLTALFDYGKETRIIVRGLEERCERAERTAQTAMGLVDELRIQLGHLQARVLAGAATEVPNGPDR